MEDSLNVAIYRRCKPDSYKQTSSYDLMEAYYKEFVKAHPGWRFAGYYSDEGNGRTDLQRLLKDCEDGQVGLIVTKSISKFAENMADGMRIIRQLKNLNPPVGVYFECENLNTLDEGADRWLLQWMMFL